MTGQDQRTHGLLGSVLLALALAGCATQGGMNAPARGGASIPSGWQYGTPQGAGSTPDGATVATSASAAAAANPTLTAEGAAPGAPAHPLALDDAWWTRFNDPALTALIERTLARNTDLGVAALRVRQAQLRVGLAESQRLPGVSARVGAEASRRLEDSRPTTRGSSATLSASWELDLWGRLAAERDVALWEARATDDDRRAVALSLAGTAALLYWEQAYLDERIAAAEQSLDYARRTVSLVDAQYRAGRVSGLEVAQARQGVSQQEAALSQLVQLRVESRQSLALLLDEPSQTVVLAAPARWPGAPWPTVSPGLPAEVLARRPDLRAAEARLRGAFAAVDATRTSYYPALTLTGSVGGSSEALSRVLSNPVGSLGAALTLPFLQWRDMQRNVAISQAEADAAVLGFRQTLYEALADVDRALSAQTQLEAQARAQDDRLAQARQVERLTERRYRSGAEPLRVWLDAQEARRQAELAAADVRYDQLSNWVSLVQALGGGDAVIDARTQATAGAGQTRSSTTSAQAPAKPVSPP